MADRDKTLLSYAGIVIGKVVKALPGLAMSVSAELIRAIMRFLKVFVFLGLVGLNVATVAVDSVYASLSGVFSAVTGLATSASDLKTRLSKAEANVTKAEAEAFNARKRSGKLQQQLEASTAQLKSSAKSLDQASEDLRLAGKTIRSKTDEVERLALRARPVRELTERISKRAAKSAMYNFDSLLAEAVPAVGVAVIVGVTAWDLHSSCETMKDMRELNLLFNPDDPDDPDEKRICAMKVPTAEEVIGQLKASPKAAWSTAKAAAKTMGGMLPDLPDISVSLPEIDLPTLRWPWK